MSELAGVLPRSFTSFRTLEKRIQLHGEEQTEKDQHDQDVSSNVCPERIEVPEPDTFRATTLKSLQGVQSNEEAVSRRAVEMGERSS